MSSREVRRSTSAPSAIMAPRISRSFSRRLTPAYSSDSSQAGWAESGGRWGQTSPTKSSWWLIFPPSCRASAWYRRPVRASTQRPSKPRVCSGCRLARRKASMVGTPGSPCFMRRMSEPLSSSAAWRKYRPSVHRPAQLAKTSRVPAEPVKPEMYSRQAKCSPTYSLP